ncbi:MAG: flagellar basal-body MS-ring/collar protein FliF [Chloroflexota bacterium]
MLAALPAPRDARGMWLNLSRNQRLTLGGIVIAAVVVVLAFVTMSRPAEFQVAFANLKDEDAAAIVTKLKDAKISYELAPQGTIKVPAAQVQEVKLMIAASGVVKGGAGTGFEIFSQPHFGLTEFAEKINYQRALEGELGRSIGRIDAVDEARVHLTLPEQSLFVSQKKDPTAAAVVQMKSGRKLDEAQVQGIVQLIAGSVEGLKVDNVTVMDSTGNVLSRRDDNDPARKQNTRVDVQRQLEQRLTEDVKTMLMPLVGPDKAVVRVSADLDWDQYESNAETFSPSQKAPQVRSRREISESAAQGTAGAAGGVPGTNTNVPSYPASGTGSQNGTAQNERRDVTTNYELSRTTEKTVRSPGAIKRLNVAVALDSEVIADPAQADAISKLVATAAGLDTNRGDLVTLTSLPFSPAGTIKPSDVAEQARQRQMMLDIARMVAMVLGPLLVVGMIWLVIRRNRPKTLKPTITEVTEQEAEAQAALKAEQELAALPVPEIDQELARVEKELVRMAKSDPAMVASLLRTWMAEDKVNAAAR